MSLPQVRVPVDLDRPRTIVLDLNALCKVEEVTGVNMLVGAPAFSSLRMMRALVWAGLLHEDPTLKIEQVGQMLQDANTAKILEAISKAYNAAIPDSDEEGEPESSDPTNPQPGGSYGP